MRKKLTILVMTAAMSLAFAAPSAFAQEGAIITPEPNGGQRDGEPTGKEIGKPTDSQYDPENPQCGQYGCGEDPPVARAGGDVIDDATEAIEDAADDAANDAASDASGNSGSLKEAVSAAKSAGTSDDGSTTEQPSLASRVSAKESSDGGERSLVNNSFGGSGEQGLPSAEEESAPSDRGKSATVGNKNSPDSSAAKGSGPATGTPSGSAEEESTSPDKERSTTADNKTSLDKDEGSSSGEGNVEQESSSSALGGLLTSAPALSVGALTLLVGGGVVAAVRISRQR